MRTVIPYGKKSQRHGFGPVVGGIKLCDGGKFTSTDINIRGYHVKYMALVGF